MSKPFVFSLYFVLLLASACYGQTRPVHGGKLSADWTQVSIQDDAQVLDIVLKPVQGMDWMIGVKVKADGVNALSVGDGSRGILYQMITGERTGPPKIIAHAADQIQTSGSSVEISGGTGGQILVAYLEVTSPRALTIQLVSFASVKDGLVIGNDTVVRKSLAGRSELAQLAMLFGAGPDWQSLVPEAPIAPQQQSFSLHPLH